MRRAIIVVFMVLGVIVLGAGGAGFYLFTQLDSLVKTAIEEVGGRALETKVSLGGVSINAFDGRGTLNGLAVANPAGFSDAEAIAVGEARVAIDTDSLTGETIVIRDVVIRAPRIRYEVGPEGGNLERLYEAVGGAVEDGSTAGTGASTDGGGTAGAERRLIVDHLLIEGAEVSVRAPSLGLDDVTVPLPTIELNDLGRSEGGLTAEQILAGVMLALQQTAAGEFAKVPALSDLLQGEAADMVKEALDSIEGGAESLGNAIKGLFGD